MCSSTEALVIWSRSTTQQSPWRPQVRSSTTDIYLLYGRLSADLFDIDRCTFHLHTFFEPKFSIMHLTQSVALLAASSSLASAGVIQLTERDIVGRQAAQSINAAFKAAGKL